MRKTILVVFFLLSNLFLLKAQERALNFSNSKIGITFTPIGNSDVFRINELEGAASYDVDKFYTFGFNYLNELNHWLEFETAFEFSKYSVVIQPSLMPGTVISSREARISLVEIPITLRANFLRYFFVNGGLFADIDVSDESPVDNQTGLGSILGLGIKYDFDPGITVFVNPYTKIHSLIPVTDRDSHQRIWENGFRFGVTYDLRR